MKWRSFVILLLAIRAVSFTGGCAPKPGTEGGKCEDNCFNTYCDDGLTCDNQTNTCVRDSVTGGASPPPAGACSLVQEPMCGAGAQEWTCSGGGVPTAFGSMPGCAELYDFGSQKEYCCGPEDTCFAPAFGDGGLGCAGGAPGTRYFCTGASAPSLPGVSCVQDEGGDAGGRGYCCAPAGDSGLVADGADAE